MTHQEAMIEAQDKAYLLTEEECFENGVMLFDEDNEGHYSFEAKKMFDKHYAAELTRIMNENNVKEELP